MTNPAGRGRPPINPDEETVSVTVNFSASQLRAVGASAFGRGYTRKVRGEDAIGGDYSRTIREIVVEKMREEGRLP